MGLQIIRADDTYAERMREVGQRAFEQDVWHLALFPPRLRDPEDPEEHKRFMLGRLHARLRNEGIYSLVAIDNDIRDSDGQVRVLGYAAWHAPGKGDNTPTDPLKDNKSGDGESEASKPVDGGEKQGWVDDGQGGKRGDGTTYPKIMDVGARFRIGDLLKAAKEEILGEGQSNIWYLGSLGVDPNYKGRGIGSKLVQWGIDRSEADGLPAYLESTAAAKGMYARLGFEYIKEISMPEDEGKPHTAMIRRPSSVRAI